ncbi:MAG: hypothetical protein CNLJKLNK_00528 [Holosporales bacterium]
MYEYLKQYVNNKNNDPQKQINWFYPINFNDVTKLEKTINIKVPSELVLFYKEIGYGSLAVSHHRDNAERFCDANTILSPDIILDILTNRGDDYMDPLSFEELPKEDIPVFEIGDGSSFMTMKPKSDNPNAVWYLGYEKIEDSFETFIYNLYYDDPAYYTRRWK